MRHFLTTVTGWLLRLSLSSPLDDLPLLLVGGAGMDCANPIFDLFCLFLSVASP